MVNVQYCECVESIQLASIQPNAQVQWLSADFEDAKATYSFIRDHFDGFYGKKMVRYFLYKKNEANATYGWVEQTEDGVTTEPLTPDPPMESVYFVVQKKDQALKELEERVAKQRTLLEKVNKIINTNKIQLQEKDAAIAKLQSQLKEFESTQQLNIQTTQFQADIEQLKTEAREWKQKFDDSQQRVDEVLVQMKAAQDDRVSLSQQVTNLSQRILFLNTEQDQEKQGWIALQQQEAAKFNQLMKEREQSLQIGYQTEIEKLLKDLTESKVLLSDVQSKLESAQTAHIQAEGDHDRSKIKYLAEISSLQNQLSEARKGLSEIKDQHLQSPAVVSSRNLEVSQLQLSLNEAQESLTKTTHIEEELREMVKSLELSIASKSEEIASLTARIDSMMAERVNQDGPRESLPADVEKIQSLEKAQKELVAGRDETIAKVKAAALKKLESMKAQIDELEKKSSALQSESKNKDLTIKNLQDSLDAQYEIVRRLRSTQDGAAQDNLSHITQISNLNQELQLKLTLLSNMESENGRLMERITSLTEELKKEHDQYLLVTKLCEELKVEVANLRSSSLALENESRTGNDAMLQASETLKEKDERIVVLESELSAIKAKHAQELLELTQTQEASTKKAKDDHGHQIDKMKTLIKDRVAKYEQRIAEMEKKHTEATKAMTAKISEALEDANKSMKTKDQKIRDLTSDLELFKKEQVEKEESKKFDFITIARVSKARDEESADALKDRWCFVLFRNSSGDVVRQGWEPASVVVAWLKQGKNWSKTDEFDFSGPAHKLLPSSIEENYEKQINELENKLRKIAQHSESQITTLKKDNETLQKTLTEIEDEFQRYKTKAANAMKHHSGQQDTLKHELTKANEDLKSRLTELNEKLMELQSEHMEVVQQMSDEIHAVEKRADQAADVSVKEQIALKQRIKQLETERDSLKSEAEKVQVHNESQTQQMRTKITDANAMIDAQAATIETLKAELKMAVAQKEAVFGKQVDIGIQTTAPVLVSSIPRSGSAHIVSEPSESNVETTSEDSVSVVSSQSEVVQITPNYSFVHDYEQGQREVELKRLRHQVRELTANLEESLSTERLLVEQKKFLEHEIRELERARKRDEVKDGAVNMQYLKNVVVKYLQTDEESLFPVLATLLQFSPEEIKHIHEEREKRNGIAAVSTSASTAATGLWSLVSPLATTVTDLRFSSTLQELSLNIPTCCLHPQTPFHSCKYTSRV